ncbi:MAG: hypothetical protein ABSE63_03160 [Thermoguttaceae bacterium]|jgi:hypothetical protein
MIIFNIPKKSDTVNILWAKSEIDFMMSYMVIFDLQSINNPGKEKNSKHLTPGEHTNYLAPGEDTGGCKDYLVLKEMPDLEYYFPHLTRRVFPAGY